MTSEKKLTSKQKKEWAFTEFKQAELNQKEIAAKVGVSEKTMSKWVNEGNWDSYTKSLLMSKSDILRNLYDTLAKMNKKLSGTDDLEEHRKYADAYIKYTASVKNLENETSVAQLVEAARILINSVQTKDPVLSLRIAEEFDLVIKERLKRF